MRTLAIDLGARRVGVALSDEGGQLAFPLDVITVSSPEQATEQVLAVVRNEGVQRLVVGVPLNMDDSVGPQARQTLAWARALASAAGLPLVLVDERLSSFEAEQFLNERKRGGARVTRKDRKQRLDGIAAAGFLQALLDKRLNPLDLG